MSITNRPEGKNLCLLLTPAGADKLDVGEEMRMNNNNTTSVVRTRNKQEDPFTKLPQKTTLALAFLAIALFLFTCGCSGFAADKAPADNGSVAAQKQLEAQNAAGQREHRHRPAFQRSRRRRNHQQGAQQRTHGRRQGILPLLFQQ
jgi:hypothetical protein